MMPKHIFPICLALCFSLTGCDDDNSSSSNASDSNATSNESTGETDAATTDAASGGETTDTTTDGTTDDGTTTDATTDTTDGTTTDDATTDDKTTSESETGNGCQDVCDGNATCENNFCVCNDGYEGDGESCSDVDECAMGSDTCDANASCSNNDGGYDCSCNDDFEGDGFSCMGTSEYFEPCEEPVMCASGLCIGPPYAHCSEYCNQAIANDCANVDAKGLCVPVGEEEFACVGDLEFGFDDDDAILSSGDSVTRSLGNLTDADLFHLELFEGGYVILAEPQGGDDIQLEVYNAIGEPIGVLNDGGPGEAEGANYNTGTGVSFAVVRNVGNTTGPYTLSVDPQ